MYIWLVCKGLLLILDGTLPILILLGKVISRGVDQQTALSFCGITKLIVALLGILGAEVYSYLIGPKDKEIDQGKDY